MSASLFILLKNMIFKMELADDQWSSLHKHYTFVGVGVPDSPDKREGTRAAERRPYKIILNSQFLSPQCHSAKKEVTNPIICVIIKVYTQKAHTISFFVKDVTDYVP